jgi:Tfp pilus assembly protein PilV
VINRNRSERGWRGRRRITVLVLVVGILGVAALGTASTASAGFTVCSGSVKVKKGNGTASFQCNTQIRAYGITSNKTVTGFGDPTVNGAPSSFLACTTQTQPNGFGCGVLNRAIAVDGTGTQAKNSTGASTTCGRSSTVLAADPSGSPPAVNGITGPPCAQVIQPGDTVTQQVSFAGNPCNTNRKNPFLVFLLAGGEPIVSTFTVRGDSLGVGEAISEPLPLKIKGCPATGKGGGKGKKSSAAAANGQAHASSGTTLEPQSSLACQGTVAPKFGKPSADTKYSFICNQNIRLFSIVTNLKADFFGVETEVTGAGVSSIPCKGGTPATTCAALESAAQQCEGPIPGYGIGCGFPDRQGNISPGGANGVDQYGRRLSAGNTLTGDLGFEKSPCVREKGAPRLRVWLVAMTEPFLDTTSVTGEFISQPFPLAVTGFGAKACAKATAKKKK